MAQLERLCFTVPESQAGRRVSDVLGGAGITAGFLRSVKYLPGGVCMDGEPVHTNHRVTANSVLTVRMPPEPDTSVKAQPIPLSICYESDFAMVLNKPAGQLVHPSVAQAEDTLASGWAFLMEQRETKAPFRPITRLDKNTSGLVLCAKNRFSAPILGQKLQKSYLAVAEGEMPLGFGVVDAPIALAQNSKICRQTAPQGKESRTEYIVLEVSAEHSLLLVRPITGRTHQIRVHMAHLGHPLAGDDMYGGQKSQITRHALHAAVLRFWEPFCEKTVRVQAPPPSDFVRLCEDLGFQRNLEQLIFEENKDGEHSFTTVYK